jgi:hypothetical protein
VLKASPHSLAPSQNAANEGGKKVIANLPNQKSLLYSMVLKPEYSPYFRAFPASFFSRHFSVQVWLSQQRLGPKVVLLAP